MMLLLAVLLLQASHPTVSAASVALRSTARTALPASAFPVGLPVVDEQGAPAGKVISVDQGMVTIKTQHALVRVPASAFVARGGPIVVGLSAAQLDALARFTTPNK